MIIIINYMGFVGICCRTTHTQLLTRYTKLATTRSVDGGYNNDDDEEKTF